MTFLSSFISFHIFSLSLYLSFSLTHTYSDTNSTERDPFESKSSSSSGDSTQRTPLILIELHMPNEIKPLAPSTYKRREIHRPPLFRRNFQRSQSATSDLCNCKVNLTPDFIVCGKEIDDRNQSKPDVDDSSLANENDCENVESVDDMTNCIDCCACFIEMERGSQTNDEPKVKSDPSRLRVNVDNFVMDSYGNLPKNAEMLKVSENDGDDGVFEATSTERRACSPNTSRVIRITLNNKHSLDGGRKQRSIPKSH